jgi:FdhD protein
MNGIVKRPVLEVTGRSRVTRDDTLAEERALVIQVDDHDVVVTLRTPGDDPELALGFLAGEGLLARRSDVVAFELHASACADEPDRIELTLAPGVRFDWSRFERHFAATAACGLCGRAHLDALRTGLTPMTGAAMIAPDRLFELAGRVRTLQRGFDATGGLHAAAWCDASLEPRVVREDVGRHNAVDKVCGWLLEQGTYGAGEGLLWVSGRAGAELVLKAARARIPAMTAVGAPSSLAVELATAAGMTLVGFLRDGRMNVYAGAERLGA